MRGVKVQVVVPTHNRPESLARCLRALQPQTAQLVVVDDGSRVPAPGSTLRNPRALGPAAARNRGWRAGSSEWVAFTDDDCVPAPDWLAHLHQAAVGAPDDVAGIGGRVLPLRPGLVSDYMTLHRILEPPESLSYLVTANCIFRRTALEQVGGFDERVRTAGGEDPGLCFALRRLGWRFLFEPRAVVQHDYRESLWDFLKTFYRYGRGSRLVLDP